MAKRKWKAPPLASYATPAQIAYAEEVQRAEDACDDAESYLGTVISHCIHAMVPLTDEMKDGLVRGTSDSWDYDRGQCEICGTDFGWRCPSSPDTVCHYFTERDGKVKLIDGTIVDAPLDADGDPHDPRFETDDCCLFCHSPEERK